MRIIISPAKKMRVDNDSIACTGLPVFPEKTNQVLQYLLHLTLAELKKLWNCNDKIAEENYQRLQDMKKRFGAEYHPASDELGYLTPAILSYDGIAYQYMAPSVFENGEFNYVQKNLRILSAFYGVVKPLDGLVPYRLEMQAKALVDGCKDLYAFWGRSLYNEVMDDSHIIINLASKEYSKCIEKYLTPQDTYITCVFGEREKDKIVQKGVYAKMARGEMVRYMAENAIEEPDQMKGFDRLGYHYSQADSDEKTYVFIRE